MRLATLSLATLVLALPASATGAVRSEVDRDAGVRLTLDGRVLEAKIVRTPGTSRSRVAEEHLYGKRIDAVCSSSFAPSRRARVMKTRVWPSGVRRLSFVFRRDISRRVKWCLLEDRARDVAGVGYIRREPARFVGKGRGPSGSWWRLAGWRGWLAEPCMHLRIPGWATRPCFSEFSERSISLGFHHFAPCGADAFVLGVASTRAATVRVVTADGAYVDAKLYDPPGPSQVRGRYFVAVLPVDTVPTRVESLDEVQRPLARRAVDELSELCF